MDEVNILSGAEAGTVVSLTRFPFSIGRRETDLVLATSGVWDSHFTVSQGAGRAFVLVPSPDAPVSVSGQQVTDILPLRNGDLIDCGAARLQFRVSPARQKSLVGRERAVWVLLLATLLAQLWFVLAWHP